MVYRIEVPTVKQSKVRSIKILRTSELYRQVYTGYIYVLLCAKTVIIDDYGTAYIYDTE